MAKRKLISMRQAGKLAGVSRQTVKAWVDSGKLTRVESGVVGHMVCTLVDPDEVASLAALIIVGRKPATPRK